ncbi:DEAD/DEAH box helicase [Candidatus Azambacteria bacterium]|nr:DEAD/DEAH box helicase [Candidatus Azambacteria bacterium]
MNQNRDKNRSSGHGKKQGGGNRFHKRPESKFGGRSGGKKRRFKESNLNINSFINKAVTTTETVEAFKPEHLFSDFALHPANKQAIRERNYIEPTPIQDKIIPHILKGFDVVGLANTGTGKTAAFLIPLIDKVLNNPKEEVLVLAPTRELALQIEDELRIFTKKMRIFSLSCVGGASIRVQMDKLRRQNHFIIGTPGRIMDLMKRGALKLANTKTLVLDEADRMLDMGFIEDIKFIISKMPEKKHTLFFSATISKEIEGLIKNFLHNPVTISVKTQDTSKNVDQDIVKIRGLNKTDLLHDLLTNPEFKKVLVFGRTKYGVEHLSKELVKRGIKAESIHGDKTQGQRQNALKRFKEGHVQALIATDVAARGLDINNVTHVINYELPATYEDYIHRIGRTGRGTKKGKALTFVN